MTEPVSSAELFQQAIRRALTEQQLPTNLPASIPDPTAAPIPPFAEDQAALDRRSEQVDKASRVQKAIAIWGLVFTIGAFAIAAYGDVIKDYISDDKPAAVVEVIKDCPRLQDEAYEKQRQNPSIVRTYGGEIEAQCHLNEITEQARKAPRSDLPDSSMSPQGSAGGEPSSGR
ncbi:hypothetical protein ACWEKT_20015 [Nocardia takedensis]|uniref:hypothetical protein n=1 Tax=Nocardia takedensis TaxID=259390 RepID=UPI0012F6D879|nr:hypothetical protein [Nocardia takedensis]